MRALTYQLVVEINHRRKELADLKVRQAIAHAIDKDFVVKTIFLGYAAAATGPVPKNDPQFYTADVPTYAFDVAKANALLDEAGYKRGADGNRFTLKLLPAPYFNETKQFGDYLRQALAAIGIDAATRQQRRRRAPEGGLHRPCLRPRRRRRRCSAATRRSRPPSWCRAASRTACRSPTRAATPTPSSTR